MTFGRRLVVAAVCLPLLAVGGCADDPKPKVAPPSEAPTSSSPTATPTPAPWEKKTNAGAVAFAKHWIDTFSKALKTAETDDLRSISAPDCVSCSAFAERISNIAAHGGFYRTPGWRVLQAAASEGLPQSRAIVALRVLQGRETYKEKTSADVVKNPASKASYSAELGWSDGAWRMVELSLVP